jgi:hypothetical protein
MCNVTTKPAGLTRAEYSARRLYEIRGGQRNVADQIAQLRRQSPRLYRQFAPLLDGLKDWMRDVSWHLEDIAAERTEQTKPATPVQQECKG